MNWRSVLDNLRGVPRQHYTPPPPEFVECRAALIKKLRSQGERAALSLEEFFEGNTDYGSIGCNLNETPGPDGFFETLKGIRSRPEVQDVLVEVRNAEVTEEDVSCWPFSDTIFLLTSAPREEVAEWLEPLQPDEVDSIETSDSPEMPPAAPALAPGMRALYAWWD